MSLALLAPLACGDDSGDDPTESTTAVATGSSGVSGPTTVSGVESTEDGGTATSAPTAADSTDTAADSTGGSTDATGSTDSTGGTAGSTGTDSGSTGGTEGVEIPTDPVCDNCTAGARVGFHGMALFGQDNHFLAHIPLYSAPHNLQLVAHIELRDAMDNLITDDFGSGDYSLAPNGSFSLDDVGLGNSVEYSADIHNGNFEHGAPVLYPNVTVTVVTPLVGKDLPDDSPIAAGTQEHYLVGETDDAYLVNFIRNDRSYQQILNVESVDGLAFGPDVAPRVVTTNAGPLGPGDGPLMTTVGDSDVTLTVDDEIWCLLGAGFFNFC